MLREVEISMCQLSYVNGLCDSRYYSVILEQMAKGTLDADIVSCISFHEDLPYAANGCVAVYIDDRMRYYCTLPCKVFSIARVRY